MDGHRACTTLFEGAPAARQRSTRPLRILCVLDAQSDPRFVAAYLAERFGSAPFVVDLLAAVARDDAVDRHGEASAAAALAATLRCALARDVEVMVYPLDNGADESPAAVVVAAANRLDSDVIVLDPLPGGLLARLRASRLLRRVLEEAACALEVVKPYAAAPRSLFNVLVPVQLDRLRQFPWERLARLPWAAGTRMELLGLAPLPALDLPAETHAFRALETISLGQVEASRAGAQLRELGEQLVIAGGGVSEVGHAIVEGAGATHVLDHARRSRVSLIVACTPPARVAGLPCAAARRFARGVVRAAQCPVLVLRETAAASRVGVFRPLVPRLAQVTGGS